MSNPQPYVPSYSFSNWQASNPTRPLPAPQVDNELANASQATIEMIAALADVRRSDGAIRNGAVRIESLATDVSLGFKPPVAWNSGTPYALNDTVFASNKLYRCVYAHTSAALFATDNTAGYWLLLADLSGTASDTGAWFSLPRVVKTANYTIVAGNAGQMVVANSGTPVTFTFDSTANLGNGVYAVRNRGLGVLTLATTGGELIEAATTYLLGTGSSALVWVDGSALRLMYFGPAGAVVIGPETAVDGNLLAFSGTSGRVFADSGIAAATVGRHTQMPEDIRTGDYTLLAADAGRVQTANSAGSITFNLPTAVAGALFTVRNIGAGTLTVDGFGSETIEGAASIVLRAGDTVLLWAVTGGWRAAFSRSSTTWLPSGAALPSTNIGPIWHDDYASFLIWQVFSANGASYTGYASLDIGRPAVELLAAPRAGTLGMIGADISTTTYAPLYNWAKHNGLVVASGSWTAGTNKFRENGGGTFRLPDLRGEFIRAADAGRGIDSGRVIGTWQDHQIQDHDHNAAKTGAGLGFGDGGAVGILNQNIGAPTTGNHGSETRGRNTALLHMIKF